jgi:hypothetical protein
MDRNEIDEKIEKLLKNMEKNHPNKGQGIAPRVPGWVKKGITGAGIVLIPYTFSMTLGSCVGCSTIEYGAPSCSKFIYAAKINITLDGTPVDAEVYCELDHYSHKLIDKIETGEYELQLCESIFSNQDNKGITVDITFEEYSRTIYIPPNSLPQTIDIELLDQ